MDPTPEIAITPAGLDATLPAARVRGRAGKELWGVLRRFGSKLIRRYGDSGRRRKGAVLWEKLREIGLQGIIAKGKGRSPLTPGGTRKSELTKMEFQSGKGMFLGMVRDFMVWLMELPVLFWLTGEERQLQHGVKKPLRFMVRYLTLMKNKFAVPRKVRPKLIRWGKRRRTEPMLLSTYFFILPCLILYFKNRTFAASYLFTCAAASFLQHLDGETKHFLNSPFICPLTATIPLVLHLTYNANFFYQILQVTTLGSALWLHQATGHPGTYSYEKYHLLWHWAWIAASIVSGIGVGKGY